MEPHDPASRALSRRRLVTGAGAGAAMLAVAGCTSDSGGRPSPGGGSGGTPGSGGVSQFTPERYGAVADGMTDDTSAIQKAIDAAFAHANSSGTFYAEVVFSPGTYKVAGRYVQGGSTKGNSQLTIPIQDVAKPKVTLVFKGPPAIGFMLWTQTAAAKNGAVLWSTGAGGDRHERYGEYAVLGGPNNYQGYGAGDAKLGSYRFNNVLVIIDGISIVTPSPANQMGIDLVGCAEARIANASVFTNAYPSYSGDIGAPHITPSDNVYATGVRLPNQMNNDLVHVDNYTCEGMYTAIELTEHAVVNNMRAIYCNVGIRATSAAHWVQIKSASLEWCHVMLDMTDGHVDALQIDMEPGQSEGWTTTDYVVANAGSRGSIRLMMQSGMDKSPVPPLEKTALPDPSGAPHVRIFDARLSAGYRSDTPAIPRSGTALVNPYWRDAMVTVFGGTVRGISVDGESTGLTSGSFTVPTGKSITLTYSVAPTWKWFLTGASF